MSCCGGARRGTIQPTARETASLARIDLVYTGATVLTAIGGATRHCYRFEHTGARLAVDARDVPGLLAIPSLRRLD